MGDGRWMIYGANGYTGQLLAEEAVSRGHHPMLAGRSLDKVQPVADRLGLSSVAFTLDDAAAVARKLEGYDVVLHAAGPFVFTSAPMLRACLDAGVSYLDVTGEISVFQHTFELDAEARAKGVCLMSGVGFDVVPTDCLAKYVADQVPGATDLEIAFAAIGSPSAGTLKSVIEGMPKGGFVRRGGRLVPSVLGAEIQRVRFVDKERTVMSIPWGDLETAFHSTGIGNITTFMAQPRRAADAMHRAGPWMAKVLGVKPIRRAVLAVVDRAVKGPGADAREAGRSHVWARASDGRGGQAQAWLETVEGYRFTAIGGVRAVERLLEQRPTGALTPSLAFGADFVLEVPDTKRHDSLPS